MTELGTVLDGKYEILKKVGQGGMSIVYLAMDNRLNKQWAVKEIKNDGSKSVETLLKGLEREANILKNVDHPVLPRIVDIINLTPRPPCNLDSAATSKVKRASWSSRCWSVKSLSSVCVLRMQKSWISFLRVRLSIILKLWRDSISVMSFTRSSRVMVSCLRTFRICSNTGLFAITFSPHWVVRTLSSVSSASAFQFSFAARTMWAH